MCGGWQSAEWKCCIYRTVYNTIALPCFSGVCFREHHCTLATRNLAHRDSSGRCASSFSRNWLILSDPQMFSLHAHVVKTMYICSQGLATESKKKNSPQRRAQLFGDDLFDSCYVSFYWQVQYLMP